MNFMIFESFWVCEALGNILTTIVSNSHFGKRPGPRDMTIFESHVGPHICNIRYLKVYESIWLYMGVYEYMEGIWEYLEGHDGIWESMDLCECLWRYIEVYDGIWRYIKWQTLADANNRHFWKHTWFGKLRYIDTICIPGNSFALPRKQVRSPHVQHCLGKKTRTCLENIKKLSSRSRLSLLAQHDPTMVRTYSKHGPSMTLTCS